MKLSGTSVSVLGCALLALSGTASATTLVLDSSWVDSGAGVYSFEGAGPNNSSLNNLPVPGSYDYSHTISASVASNFLPAPAPANTYEFYDDYIFTVTGAVANSVTSTISLGSLLGISNLQARLYSYAPGSLPQLGAVGGLIIQAWSAPISCGVGCTGETVVINEVLLNPGTYVLELRGVVSGSVSGSYGGALNLAPVPVPAAAWLFGGALGLLGWIRRRA